MEGINVKAFNGRIWSASFRFSSRINPTYVPSTDRTKVSALDHAEAEGYSRDDASQAYDLITHHQSSAYIPELTNPLKKQLEKKYGKSSEADTWRVNIGGKEVDIILEGSKVIYNYSALEEEKLVVQRRIMERKEKNRKAEENTRNAEKQKTLDGL